MQQQYKALKNNALSECHHKKCSVNTTRKVNDDLYQVFFQRIPGKAGI
jgi:hypothetical protein